MKLDDFLTRVLQQGDATDAKVDDHASELAGLREWRRAREERGSQVDAALERLNGEISTLKQDMAELKAKNAITTEQAQHHWYSGFLRLSIPIQAILAFGVAVLLISIAYKVSPSGFAEVLTAASSLASALVSVVGK